MSHRAPKYAPLQLSSPRIPLQLFLFGKHAPPSPPPFFNFATSFSTALLSFLLCLCFIGLHCIPATLSFILARGIAFNSFDTSKQVHACTLSCPQLLCHLFAHTDGQVLVIPFYPPPLFHLISNAYNYLSFSVYSIYLLYHHLFLRAAWKFTYTSTHTVCKDNRTMMGTGAG